MCVVCACGGDDVEQTSCGPGERLNPVSGQCVEALRDGDVDADELPDGDSPDDADAGAEDASEADAEVEDVDADELPELCGMDMDLSSATVCTFYVHSPSMLYRLDPFRRSLEQVRSVPEGLFDIDTHPDGRLFGVSPETLYRFEPATETWTELATLSGLSNPNGLCIDNFGQGYLTSHDELYEVDLESAQVTRVGTMGSGFSSSGDCVVNKGNTLFVSSAPRGFYSDDELVQLDALSGEGALIGRSGVDDIYGLTAAWGELFGTTGDGRLVRLNPGNGRAEVLHDFGDVVFHGAASSPER
ncbi:hypothetical protein DL240_14200 [Lujinxingia litoralis]|uniref:SMP-30/Gluconolactonase/LRE-like region domain-containing protein n=1 Tax=Lujinxingia litoralis TaxID=2211119 RepID=A0A328C5S5_9DELT|nr:hypothetical protein DL240_14200 [Lujinxingia litoralis]